MSLPIDNTSDDISIDYDPYDPQSPYYDPNLVNQKEKTKKADESSDISQAENQTAVAAADTTAAPVTKSAPAAAPLVQAIDEEGKASHARGSGKRALFNAINAKNALATPSTIPVEFFSDPNVVSPTSNGGSGARKTGP